MKRVDNMDELHGRAIQVSPSTAHRPVVRWPFIVSTVFLFLAAAGLGAGFTLANHSAQEWRTTAQQSAKDLGTMTKERNGLKVQADELQIKLSDTQKKLDEMTTQHNAATDRIRSLSDEKAQAGDQAASFATLVVMSQDVTQQLDACINDLQKLQTYLVDYRSYDSAALINYSRQINLGCNRARADSDALSRQLAG